MIKPPKAIQCFPLALAGWGTLCTLCLLSGNSLAQAPQPIESPGASLSVILQTLLSLGVVVGMLFAAAWLIRRVNGGRGFGNRGPLRIVGGLMVSPRERIVLIEIENQWLVVGIVPGQIKTLHTLPKGELPQETESDKPFGQWLKQFSDRKNETV